MCTIRSKTFILGLSIFIFLAGCSIMSAEPASSEEALKIRVTALMNARVNKDYGKVYSFFTSEFKKSVPLSSFIVVSGSRPGTVSYEIKSIQIAPSGETADVLLINTIIMNGSEFKGLQHSQKWKFENNEWYLFVKPVLNAMGG